jgi:tetratricopeptide (TPR) repeat protein
MQCANKTSVEHLHKVISNIHSSGGPTLGVGLVTYATSDIWEYTAFSLAVNQAYAEQNGYVMVHLDEKTSNYDKDDARWNKVKILEEAIHPETGWARDLDYVMWLDADLIFLDLGMRLEKVAAEYPKAHVIMSAEHAGSSTLVNSGTVLIKNSNWSRKFLNDWWTFATRKFFSDQEQFDLLYEAKREEYKDKVAVLPPDALNSDPPAMTRQKPYNQVCHLMGEHTPYRVKAFGSAFKEICRKYRPPPVSDAPLSQQLTVTRDNLLQWTYDEYSIEYNDRMAKFLVAMTDGGNDIKKHRLLANAAHHYAHALEHSGSPEDVATAVGIRNQTFQVLYTNLKNRRKRNQEHKIATGRVMEDWPELMKSVCEAGQHMVGLGTSDERRHAASLTMALLEELVNTCHHQQRPAVMHMIASLKLDVGLIDFYDNKYEDALVHFEASLKIYRKLAESSGQHIMVSILHITANTLAGLRRYKKAHEYFDLAIKLTENHVGLHHDSLADILLNYAISKKQEGHRSEAKKMLYRALEIMKGTNRPQNDPVFKSAAYNWNQIISEEKAERDL